MQTVEELDTLYKITPMLAKYTLEALKTKSVSYLLYKAKDLPSEFSISGIPCEDTHPVFAAVAFRMAELTGVIDAHHSDIEYQLSYKFIVKHAS